MGIVLAALTAILGLIIGIWWSKFRGVFTYRIIQDESVELRPLMEDSESDCPFDFDGKLEFLGLFR